MLDASTSLLLLRYEGNHAASDNNVSRTPATDRAYLVDLALPYAFTISP